MTLYEFLDHLDSQPWKFDYITTTMATYSPDYAGVLDNFISGAFIWEDSPQGHDFWSLLNNTSYTTLATYHQLIQALHTRYYATYPELFI